MPHAGSKPIAVMLLLMFAGSAAAEPVLAQSKLNLRTGPGPAFATLAVLPPGTKFDAQKCSDEWCRVKFGRQVGYVSRAYLGMGADSYASVAPAAAPAPSKPALPEPRVWQWNDGDWRNEHWRRLEWHNRMSGR
jgi:uncharacterized protein YraI